MKYAILVVVAACAGALAIFAIPSNLLWSGFASMHGLVDSSGLTRISLADLNPLKAVFDFEQQRVNTGYTPDQLGFHSSPMVLSPFQMPTTNLDSFKAPLGPGGNDPQAYMEMQQNNQRMQDMRTYMNDPNHWIGPPPH